MDITREIIHTNPREKANPLSILFFTYTIQLFVKGYKKTFDIDDLYNPLSEDRSTKLGDRLEGKWAAQVDKTKKTSKSPSLLKTIGLTFWQEYLYLGITLAILEIGFKIMQPLMLGELLEYFKPGSTKTKNDAFLRAGGVVALNGCVALLTNQYMMLAFHNAVKVRAACCSTIYRKALRLSRSAVGESAAGKVVNLLSNDVSRFEIFSYLLHYMWVAPTTAVIISYFLYARAGYAGLIGMLPIFLVVPTQGYAGQLASKFRRKTAYKTDERIRLMDEIVSGVQVIKMYAWEKPFEKIIKFARKLELIQVMKLSYVRGVYMTFNLFTTRMSLFCTLLTIALSGEEIAAANVFVYMSYFNVLSNTMSSMFVRGISEIAEALVAIKRIELFLLKDEYKNIMMIGNTDDSVAVGLQKVTTKWDPDAEENALANVSVTVPKGKLLGVIGPVGCGKSSFLQTILGELIACEGTVHVNGKISYAPQEAWVFSATIRQNITFGKEFERRRYHEVVRACALETDFKQFPDGDLSIVGERGTSLSGGQKARINLARAVYREADIYLLDDPLSAVDVPVAKHLYQKCINGFLKQKTRILITHQVHHLQDADNIIIFNNGEVDMQGTFSELSNSDHFYAEILKQEIEPEEEKSNLKLRRHSSLGSRTNSVSSVKSDLIDGSTADLDDIQKDYTAKDMQEESSKGKVGGSIFLKYLLAGSNACFVGVVLTLFALAQTAASSTDYFVSYWVDVEEANKKSAQTNDVAASRNFYLSIYGGLIATLFVVALARSLLFYFAANRSSQKLHDRMFISIINTDMHFFNTNPSGRILNRFSKDIGAVDELLPKAVLDAGQIVLLMIGSVVLVSITNLYFLIPVLIIGTIFMGIRTVYLRSSKNIKRLEGMTRSPVFTHLNATLQGLTTIRAFTAQNVLKCEYDKHQDLHTSASYMYLTASCAFGFVLDLLCFAFTFIVTFTFVLFYDSSGGGNVGLAITQASALTGMVQWGVRQSAEVANQLVSVERILEYYLLAPEKQPAVPKTPSPSWPSNGKVSFQDVGLRYSEYGELVLKNLNVLIQPREKVGIVGRTGAGKSSLIAAMFKLALLEGKIEIDGVFTDELNLQFLRSKISIIPQDPVLFSGTLRYNLDPFDQYSDHDLYAALQEVELKDPANIINKLEYRVLDRGSNYSVGQRQLICLARALIRNNKILMLDEATANVDPQTDAVIQKTIREKFATCTVLTIAHRLNTIMDSDKVLVMDSGTVIEFNHPHILLQNHKSMFYKMVVDTGKSMMEQLKLVAKQSYESKHKVPE